MGAKPPGFVRPPTLTATVTDHIRQAIVRGEFGPSAPLHEVDLGKSLSVSRGTVREALRQLQDEGLVEVIPHQGAFVIKLSPRKAWEIYTLRAQLEPYAVRLALENRAYVPQDLDALEALVHRMGELERRNEQVERLAADMEFHRIMCERSNHDVLMDVLRSLQSQTRLFIFNTMLYHSDLVGDEPSHRRILETIREGDPTRAEEIVRDHIVQAGTSLLRRMAELEPSADQVPPAASTLKRDGTPVPAVSKLTPVEPAGPGPGP